MAGFRTMQKLMIKAQDKAKEIRHLQDTVLPKLKQQLADTKGIFKGKERKALTEQIQRTEKEIAEKLDKLPDVLKEDGYPDVQAFMATYRKRSWQPTARRRLLWSSTTVTLPHGSGRSGKNRNPPKKSRQSRPGGRAC